MSTEKTTLSYSRIVERRPKAVSFDIGERRPIWLTLSKIEIDEEAYTVTAPRSMIDEQIANAQGAPMKRDPGNEARVTLPPPVWENAKSIGIDVVISGFDGSRKVRELLYFPKSQMQGNTAPRWLVEKIQNEALAKEAKKRRWERKDLILKPFKETGLLGEAVASDPEPKAPANEETPAPPSPSVTGSLRTVNASTAPTRLPIPHFIKLLFEGFYSLKEAVNLTGMMDERSLIGGKMNLKGTEARSHVGEIVTGFMLEATQLLANFAEELQRQIVGFIGHLPA